MLAHMWNEKEDIPNREKVENVMDTLVADKVCVIEAWRCEPLAEKQNRVGFAWWWWHEMRKASCLLRRNDWTREVRNPSTAFTIEKSLSTHRQHLIGLLYDESPPNKWRRQCAECHFAEVWIVQTKIGLLEAQSGGVKNSGMCGRHGEELGRRPNASTSIIGSLENCWI